MKLLRVMSFVCSLIVGGCIVGAQGFAAEPDREIQIDYSKLPSIQMRYLELPALMAEPSGANPVQQINFPAVLCNIKNVESFSMTGHLFSRIPAEIANWARTLRRLDLSQNKITGLPDEINALVFLESLDLHSNPINSLPANMSSMRKLSTLLLSDNLLQTVPATIGELTGLETLDLSDNPFTSLPDSMANLTSLQYLKLNGTKLAKVPAFLPYLVNLEKLEMKNLTSFPDTERRILNAIFKPGVVVYQ